MIMIVVVAAREGFDHRRRAAALALDSGRAQSPIKASPTTLNGNYLRVIFFKTMESKQ